MMSLPDVQVLQFERLGNWYVDYVKWVFDIDSNSFNFDIDIN